ncbi:MAG: ABC transporter ATP-binding protein [Polyangiaceae bacterium]|jgi:peptide/nickel transport system ATP-binding protein|nr:ABC transporter ATP-binding protein [Polyangiaceae bacterium]
MAEPLLRVQDLQVGFASDNGLSTAVDGVSFDVHAGQIVGLAGESGCGKSTIAGAILRVLPPPAIISAGAVVFGGRDVLRMTQADLRAFRWRQVSMVFQSAMNALHPVLPIGEQFVDVLQAHTTITRKQALARAEEMLALVHIDRKRVSGYAHELSGGMRQRVVIALALCLEPKLVIFDEPTTALDVVVQRDILRAILALQQQRGFAVIFITHDLPIMLSLCQRIGVLYAGKLVEFAESDDVRNEPKHPYTKQLLGAFSSSRSSQQTAEASASTLAGPPSQTGCRFQSRCRDRFEPCQKSAPALEQRNHQHWVACHRAQ